jgi:hypothetical protein
MINLWDVTVGMNWTSGKTKSLTEYFRDRIILQFFKDKGTELFFSSLRINIGNIIPVYIEQAWRNCNAVPQMKCAMMQLVYTVSFSWMYPVLYDN